MRRAWALLAALTLAACAAPAQTSPDILPVEAARIVDRATATAGAMSTQIAQTTATARADAATSTAAAAGTRDTLSVQQTQVGLQLTSAAGAAAIADTQAVKTRSAAATDAWATPTAAAIMTQRVVSQEELAFRRAREASAAEFWQTLRFLYLAGVVILLGLVTIAGLAWVVVEVIKWRAQIRLAELRAKADIARDAFRMLPGHWAEYTPGSEEGSGYQVYALPGAGDAPPALLPEPVTTTPDYAHGWRVAFMVMAWAASRYGWSHSVLAGTDSPHRIMTEPAWRKMTRILRAKSVITGSNEGTRWAGDYNYDVFVDALRSGRLALPYPNEPAPVVSAGGLSHTTPPHHAPPHPTPVPN